MKGRMMTRDNARRTGPALERMQQFLIWLVPAIEKFPRSQKFTQGDRIQSTCRVPGPPVSTPDMPFGVVEKHRSYPERG